jgi:hypothetical protein
MSSEHIPLVATISLLRAIFPLQSVIVGRETPIPVLVELCPGPGDIHPVLELVGVNALALLIPLLEHCLRVRAKAQGRPG